VIHVERITREKINGSTVNVGICPSKVVRTKLKLDKDHKALLDCKARGCVADKAKVPLLLFRILLSGETGSQIIIPPAAPCEPPCDSSAFAPAHGMSSAAHTSWYWHISFMASYMELKQHINSYGNLETVSQIKLKDGTMII
jgi:Ribosomal proteins L26 eukaryotic, L24P archaeal